MSGLRIEGSAETTPLRIGGEPGITEGAREAAAAEGPSFSGILEKMVMSASAQDHDAIVKAEALAAGRSDDLHGTMIAMKEADISLKLVGNVRNKLLDAFHELWRTSV